MWELDVVNSIPDSPQLSSGQLERSKDSPLGRPRVGLKGQHTLTRATLSILHFGGTLWEAQLADRVALSTVPTQELRPLKEPLVG